MKHSIFAILLVITSWKLGVRAEDEYLDYYVKEKYLRNCDDVFNSGYSRSGVYDIFTGGKQIQVFCHLDAQTRDHWMIIQRRNSGQLNFYQPYKNYQRGFGDLWKEFWLGLDNLHAITSSESYRLRIEMEDYFGRTAYADYGDFAIGKEKDNYPLHIKDFLGGKAVELHIQESFYWSDISTYELDIKTFSAGDSLLKHNNCSFSTFDKDNDEWLGNCALVRHGGWWYKRCCYSNLNGKYFLSARIDFAGMMWFSWKKNAQTLKGVVMMIQPNQITPQEMVL